MIDSLLRHRQNTEAISGSDMRQPDIETTENTEFTWLQ